MKRMGLREARERAKLTQQQLADASGVPQPIISRLETGTIRNPGFEVVLRLAKALKVDAQRLIFGKREAVAS